MKKLNTKGFGAVEVLAIIFCIAVLGFVGYKAYSVYTASDSHDKQLADRRRESNEFESEAETEKVESEIEAEETSADTTKYLEVSKWGIKLPLADSGISYKLKHNNTYAEFKTNALNKFDSQNCTNFLYVARGTANEVAGVQDGPANSSYTFAKAYADYKSNMQDAAAVKVGNYYYLEFVGGAECSGNNYKTQLNIIRKALLKAEKI